MLRDILDGSDYLNIDRHAKSSMQYRFIVAAYRRAMRYLQKRAWRYAKRNAEGTRLSPSSDPYYREVVRWVGKMWSEIPDYVEHECRAAEDKDLLDTQRSIMADMYPF